MTRFNRMNAAHSSPSLASLLLQGGRQVGLRGPPLIKPPLAPTKVDSITNQWGLVFLSLGSGFDAATDHQKMLIG
jgi:hypothetical protein